VIASAAQPGAAGHDRRKSVAGAATPGIAALVKAGVPHQVFKFDHDPRASSFGAEAVEALTKTGSVAPEQIYKTLIIAAPDGLAVAILPASSRLSLKAAAAALGVAKASMADAAAAERATGYVVGAVSPFGQRRPLRAVVDSGALAWDRIFCSAGRRGLDVAVAPADLIRLTGAITAGIRA
jgi:Cys-tRNA(Pro)/Cys-tRNA(Cys) deacylase